MTRLKNLLSAFLLLSCSFLSCRNELDDPYPVFDASPAVNAFLIVGEPLNVHVSMAGQLDTLPMPYVDNAQLALYVNDEFAEMLTYTDGGWYRSTTIVEPLKKYQCEVIVPGYDSLTASQLMPSLPHIKNIEHINIAGKNEEGTSYPAIKISFHNSLDAVSFYEVKIRNYRAYRQDTFITNASVHTIVDPVILNEGLPIALFSNEMIGDSVYTMHLNYSSNSSTKHNKGPWRTELFPLIVELRQLTEDAYRFKKQLYLYHEGLNADGILSSMTNNNLYSNVENGFGIFAGYAYTLSDTIIPNTEGYYE